ncbi:polymer-forming cytoskeletal protein [candidate division KSB1 bacterium]
MREENTTIKSSDIISTVVGAGTRIKGSINIKNSGRIDGIVEGGVTSSQDVVVGEGGFIEGRIVSRQAIIGGKVIGSIDARDKVVLESKAFLQGDIHTKKLRISDGAFFMGNAFMLQHHQSLKSG